jgi:hypothetical protein
MNCSRGPRNISCYKSLWEILILLPYLGAPLENIIKSQSQFESYNVTRGSLPSRISAGLVPDSNLGGAGAELQRAGPHLGEQLLGRPAVHALRGLRLREVRRGAARPPAPLRKPSWTPLPYKMKTHYTNPLKTSLEHACEDSLCRSVALSVSLSLDATNYGLWSRTLHGPNNGSRPQVPSADAGAPEPDHLHARDLP